MKLECVSFLVLFACVGSAAELSKVTGDVVVTETSTVAGVANPDSVIDVRFGVTTLTAGQGTGYELPADLRDGLGLWLDANVNTVEGSVDIARYHSNETNTYEGVVEWRDVRETGTKLGEFRYPRAVINRVSDMWNYGDLMSVPPTWYADEDNHPGLKFLDFGDFASGQWMMLADGKGNSNGDVFYDQPVKTFFLVVGFHDTLGHLLAHAPGRTTVDVNKIKMFFHKQSGSSGDGPLASSNSANSNWRRGETRLNGEMIDPVKTTPEKGGKMMLISQVGPEYADIGDGLQTPYFNTLLNHGNLTSTRGYTSRQGGAIYGEILVYERVLSDVERQRVEAYLMAKWFGKGAAGELRTADGAKVSVDGESPTTVGAATGAGTVEKSGSATLKVVGNGTLETAAYAFAGGKVSQTEKVAPVYVRPASGKVLTVSGGDYTVADGAADGTFRVIGSNGAKVMLPPGAYDGLTLDVRGADLIVAPRAQKATVADVTPAWADVNLLKDESFEGLTTGDNVTLENAKASAWTSSGYAGAAILGKYSTDIWYGCHDNEKEYGTHILALQGKTTCGAVSQTFTAPITGRYRLSYWMARRVSRSEGDGDTCLKVLLDGQVILYNPFRKVNGAWDNRLTYNETDLPLMTAGSEHTLTLAVNDNCTTDRAVVLDMIRLVPVEETTDYIFIPDAGFEQTPWFPEMTTPNGTFKEATAPENWFAWTWNGEGGCGITRDSTWWAQHDGWPRDVARDRQKVYLQTEAAISTQVYVPRAGRLRLKLRYSNRCRGDISYADDVCWSHYRDIGHNLVVSLDEAVLATIRIEQTSRQRTWTSTSDFAGESGWKTLTIANARPTGSTVDLASVVDDIALEYADDVSDPVLREVPVERTFTVSEAGYYLLRLPVGAYVPDPLVHDTSFIWSTCFPTVADITVDGAPVGGVRLEAGDLKEYVYALPYLTAGEHELVAVGTKASSVNAELRIGQLKLEKLETPVGADVYDLSGLKILLDANSKLDLRYSGALKLGKLRHAGKGGYTDVSAETCPDWVLGTGSFGLELPGMLLLLR